MKISENSVNIGQQAYAKEIEATKPAEISNDEGSTGEVKAVGDKVSLSKSARDIQIAKDAVEAVPEIREEAVQDLKKEVDSGTYEINSNQIAEKMVGANIDEVI
jgi:flagellar biosynthesis anti-sigma factor FlgM